MYFSLYDLNLSECNNMMLAGIRKESYIIHNESIYNETLSQREHLGRP